MSEEHTYLPNPTTTPPKNKFANSPILHSLFPVGFFASVPSGRVFLALIGGN
jgi:hypothetical protein